MADDFVANLPITRRSGVPIDPTTMTIILSIVKFAKSKKPSPAWEGLLCLR